MSTVNLDESLYRRTIEVALAKGQSVDEFVSEAVRRVIEVVPTFPAAFQRTSKNGIDVLILNGATPSLDVREARRTIEEQGL